MEAWWDVFRALNDQFTDVNPFEPIRRYIRGFEANTIAKSGQEIGIPSLGKSKH